MNLPQASQEAPVFDFVDGFASFNWGRGFKCTAFSPLILYVYQWKQNQNSYVEMKTLATNLIAQLRNKINQKPEKNNNESINSRGVFIKELIKPEF